MKKIMPHIAAVGFSLFGLAVIALLMSYTFEALAYIFPDNFTAQVMGMILFDVAALAWLGAFIYLCRSVMQYAFAFIGFVVGLLGSLGMVAIDVMLGGQAMIEPPAWINSALIYGFIGAAVAHVILIYAYKLASPEISADISLGIETANITEEAMKQAEGVLLAQRGALGNVIAPRLVDNVRRNLGLPVMGDVIDLPAYDLPDQAQAIPAQIPARRMSFTDRLKAAAQVLVNPAPAPARAYQTTAPAPAPLTPAPAPISEPLPVQTPPAPIPSPIAQTPINTPAPQAETVQEVIAAGLCACPPDFFADKKLQPEDSGKIRVYGYPLCWDTYADVKHKTNASAAEVCAACPFYKGKPKAESEDATREKDPLS